MKDVLLSWLLTAQATGTKSSDQFLWTSRLHHLTLNSRLHVCGITLPHSLSRPMHRIRKFLCFQRQGKFQKMIQKTVKPSCSSNELREYCSYHHRHLLQDSRSFTCRNTNSHNFKQSISKQKAIKFYEASIIFQKQENSNRKYCTNFIY